MAIDLALLVSRIYQKDSHRFTIEWADGRRYDYALADLQENCPCARCREESKNNSFASKSPSEREVFAIRIYNVGRYALRIEFTKGCSRGIYTFAFLKELGKLSCDF